MPKNPPVFEVIFDGTVQPAELQVSLAPVVLSGLHAMASQERGVRDYATLAKRKPAEAYDLLRRELLWMSEHVKDLDSTVKGSRVVLNGDQDSKEATNRASRRRMEYILGRADPREITFDVDLWRLHRGLLAAKRIVRFRVPGPRG